eukprot:COSAG02_NODE_28_length_51367_cov_70.053932_47_plen_1313_part_00
MCGQVDLEELASFFETMNAASGADGEDPEEEAAAVIEGMGDGEVIDLEALTDLLVETFAEDLDLLEEIEELLRVRQEDMEAQAADKLAQAWTARDDSDSDGDDGSSDGDDSDAGGDNDDGDGDDDSAGGSDGEEEDAESEGSTPGSPESPQGELEPAVGDEDALMALHGVAESVTTACDEQHEARDHELRNFFMSVRLMLKRRRRRLLREVQHKAAENKTTVDELLATWTQDIASGQELLQALSTSEAEGEGEEEGDEREDGALVEEFVGKPARLPEARCVKFASLDDAHATFLGLGKLETSWWLCLDAILTASAAGADSHGAVELLIKAADMVGKLPEGADSLAAETVEQLCHVMASYVPGGELDLSQYPQLLPAFAKALKTIARQSTETASIVGTEEMTHVVLVWLKHGMANDEVAMHLFDLLSVLCAMSTLPVLDLFLTESDGVNVCLRAFKPGRRVECMTAALSLITVMATSTLEGGDETLHDLVVEMVLEADNGVERIVAATKAVSDEHFHAAACRVFTLLATVSAGEQGETTPANHTFAADHSASVVNAVLTDVLPQATVVSVEPAGEVLVALLRTVKAQGEADSAAKLTARALETKGLSLLRSILEDETFCKVEIQRLYVSILAKMAIMNDIKAAIMRAGLIETVCATLRNNSTDVMCSIRCAEALSAISKQQDEVKAYIAKKLSTLNPLGLLTQALRLFADNEELAKSAATALWSIAYKNNALKSSAGKCGAFILLCSAARMHRTKVTVLPHIFVALGNLCANHGPNQLEAGSTDVITICVEFLAEHMESATMVFAILNCLNSLISGELEGQDANHAAFLRAGGQSVLDECTEHHSSAAKVVSLCAAIQESLEEGKANAEAALKQRLETENLTVLEAQELAVCQPNSAWHRLDKRELTTVIRGPKQLHVKHKKGRATVPQTVILHKHSIKFLENVKGKKKKQIIDRYSIPLFSAVELDKEAPKVVIFTTRTDDGLEMNVRMTCDGVADAKEWFAAIRNLMPIKSTTMECATASAFAASAGKSGSSKGAKKAKKLKLEPRLASWQGGALFIFNLSKDKAKSYKLQRAFPAADLTLEEAGVGRQVDGFVLEDLADKGRGFYFTGDGGATIPAKMWIKEIQKQQEQLKIEVAETVAAKRARTRHALTKVKMMNALGREGRQRKLRLESEAEERRRREEEEDEMLDAKEAQEEAEQLEAKEAQEAAAALEADKAAIARVKARADQTQLASDCEELRRNLTEVEQQLAAAKEQVVDVEYLIVEEEELLAGKEAYLMQMVEQLKTELGGRPLPRSLELDLTKFEREVAER